MLARTPTGAGSPSKGRGGKDGMVERVVRRHEVGGLGFHPLALVKENSPAMGLLDSLGVLEQA